MIETERLTLRRILPSDYLAMYSWRGDPQVARYMLSGAVEKAEDVIPWLEQQDPASDEKIICLIERKSDGLAVGSIGMFYDPASDTWTFGYNLRRDEWGKGYATEALRAMMDHVRRTYGAHRFEGEAAVANPASLRVMGKCDLAEIRDSSFTNLGTGECFPSKVYALEDRGADAHMTEEVQRRLFALQDAEYRLFQARLMPTIDVGTIIGVRTPELRKLAKELKGAEHIGDFLAALPHRYYDETNLHGFLISELKDYAAAAAAVDALLPYVDNWATCDLLSPKAFRKNRALLRADVLRWMSSDRPFTVRFGIEMAMSHFLDDGFDPSLAERIAAIRSEEYYVRMMVAWYFATALAKQWDAIIPFVEDRRLDPWTHNKTIQKAIESYRITDEQKAYLRSLKVK